MQTEIDLHVTAVTSQMDFATAELGTDCIVAGIGRTAIVVECYRFTRHSLQLLLRGEHP